MEDLQRLAKQAEKGWTVGCEEKQNIVKYIATSLATFESKRKWVAVPGFDF